MFASRMKILVMTALLVSSVLPSRAFSQENRPEMEWLKILVQNPQKALTTEEEQSVAKGLRLGTEVYLTQVKRLGPWSFKDRTDISSESALYLKMEADSITADFTAMSDALQSLETSSPPYSVAQWALVAQAISVNSGYMDDLQEKRLVKSEWPRALTIGLRGLFTKVINPRLRDLVRRCGSNSDKPKP